MFTREDDGANVRVEAPMIEWSVEDLKLLLKSG